MNSILQLVSVVPSFQHPHVRLLRGGAPPKRTVFGANLNWEAGPLAVLSTYPVSRIAKKPFGETKMS